MNKVRDWFIKSVKSNRGMPRIWLQGKRYEKIGFAPGQRYVSREEAGCLFLELSAVGSRVVCSKRDGERVDTVIDLNSGKAVGQFEGMDQVRVVLEDGRIMISPLASEERARERLQRLAQKIEQGDPILTGSVAHGGGILSHAIHKGLAEAGIPSELAFANEVREELLEHASDANEVWSDTTVMLSGPMQELAFDSDVLSRLPSVEVMEMGIPCTAASLAGRAKKGLKQPEDDPGVGHLIVAAINLIARMNPAVVVFENVVPYRGTASAGIFRSQLRDLGYEVHEAVLNAGDFNALEERRRLVMVAVTRGMHFDFACLRLPEKETRTVGQILEPIADDDPSWSSMPGLVSKALRDKTEGNGFKMQVIDATATRVPTFTKGMSRNRSTDVKFRHPRVPELMRVPTPIEHARVKDVDPALIRGLCKTTAHEVLGQSICWRPFFELARQLLSETLRKGRSQATAVAPVLRELVQIDLFEAA